MHRPPPPAALPVPKNPSLPRHIGIIMDGNGRWAKRHHVPRAAGHRNGVRAIRRVMQACHDRDVNILTLYAFSTENWSRPGAEVRALMKLFGETITSEIDELDREGVQVRMFGDIDALSPALRDRVIDAENRTATNTAAIVNVALNYGGRAEIVAAVSDLQSRGKLENLDEKTLSDALYTGGLPDPDLIIRTAGELRLSNFLIWQAAYAEIFVTDTLWPDMGDADIEAALAGFASRERRFGGRKE